MVNFTVASSNCSEAISRQSQTQNITPSRSVCRNLFGTINHDEIREEVRKQNIERLQEKKLRYNFDFEKEEPLPGRYVWEKVSNINRTKNCSKIATKEEVVSRNIGSEITEMSTKKRLSKDQGEQKITEYFRAKKRKYEETTTEKEFTKTSKIKHISKTDLDSSCTCLSSCKCP